MSRILCTVSRYLLLTDSGITDTHALQVLPSGDATDLLVSIAGTASTELAVDPLSMHASDEPWANLN